MTLFETLQHDLKESLKRKDAIATSTLRMLLSAIQYAEINKKGDALPSNEVILTVMKQQVKQRKDAIEAYDKAGRLELKEKETKELHILESYLPKQLDDNALTALIKQVLQDTGITAKKDMGTVIRMVIERASGAADGKRVSTLVAQKLA